MSFCTDFWRWELLPCWLHKQKVLMYARVRRWNVVNLLFLLFYLVTCPRLGALHACSSCVGNDVWLPDSIPRDSKFQKSVNYLWCDLRNQFFSCSVDACTPSSGCLRHEVGTYRIGVLIMGFGDCSRYVLSQSRGHNSFRARYEWLIKLNSTKGGAWWMQQVEAFRGTSMMQFTIHFILFDSLS